jgi:hypothetical protein
MTMWEWVRQIWRRWLGWGRKKKDKTQKNLDEKTNSKQFK